MIRGPLRTDQGYIASSWSKSILRGTHAWERHRTARNGHQINKLIDDVMDRSDTRALLRVRPHDPDAILGWVVYCAGAGTPIIHYLFVTKDARGDGIGSELLLHAGVKRDTAVVCTSDGPSSAMMRTLYPAAVHMPLAAFLKPPNG